jgi:hypothetical protein
VGAVTIRGERAITRVFDAPSAASRFTDESALDSSRVITELDNNSAHLCEESVRHLVTDAGFALTSLGTNDYVGYVGGASLDVTIPSADQVDHVWQEIGWDNVVARRYGPFCLTPDVGERPVSARPRSVRVVVEVDVPSVSGNAGFACALTRSSSPIEIIDGRYIAAGETSASRQATTFDSTSTPRRTASCRTRAGLSLGRSRPLPRAALAAQARRRRACGSSTCGSGSACWISAQRRSKCSR